MDIRILIVDLKSDPTAPDRVLKASPRVIKRFREVTRRPVLALGVNALQALEFLNPFLARPRHVSHGRDPTRPVDFSTGRLTARAYAAVS